ncbi:multicopper oxidase [Catellatospora methionotrophica]|uniref:Multicopper oxidase n=1 Tax=Catellatospora methionotrophica TaxID=121620 RepID=A0A8J3LBG3_9ACTN|nr:multicopper oxidase domain-containing protein [Catellatospora methionotrophica]GIG15103.1 multicopper oxidase [Catellatospora methionotrophica]
MVDRRRILQASVAIGAAAALSQQAGWAWAAGRAGALHPRKIRKYVTPLTVPPVMSPERREKDGPDHYRIGVRQFRQQILPKGMPRTTVWGYGDVSRPGRFRTPAGTIEATVDRPVRVTWVNELVDGSGGFRPHLLAVDPTLHWANPPGGESGRDSRPTFTATPGPYRGPVPIVTHLHGGRSTQDSCGYPEAWYLPQARDIPHGHATVGTFHDAFGEEFTHRHGTAWQPGSATFHYGNDQRAATLWYHDHALGLTRLNVYAGLAGYYLLRGGAADLPPGVLPGPAPRLGDRPGTRYHEIPLMVQDRSFNTDGSLFYPASRAFTDDAGPYLPDGPFPPIWNPAFLADTMMVNGSTWPVLEVEPRRYRLRLLNACNSRVLIMKIAADRLAARPAPAALPIWQIGNDGGFLPEPVSLQQLLLGPAERADVIVDFTGLREGTELYLINEGPDVLCADDFNPSDPATTGQVMKFTVGRLTGRDRSVAPEDLDLPRIRPLGHETRTRRLALDEELGHDHSVKMMLYTIGADGHADPRHWHDPVTEQPALNSTEVWELHNWSAHAHPVHLHVVQFEVLGRGKDGRQRPRPGDRGLKDTVLVFPGEITRVKAAFDLAGRYVWHCHLLEHEDNDMMRPFLVR